MSDRYEGAMGLRTVMVRLLTAGLCCLVLGACAHDAPVAEAPVVWRGGDPAHLAADRADCKRESAGVDVRQAEGYSDPRYGVSSAMARAVSDYDPLVDTRAAQRTAAFYACMNDKGWKPE